MVWFRYMLCAMDQPWNNPSPCVSNNNVSYSHDSSGHSLKCPARRRMSFIFGFSVNMLKALEFRFNLTRSSFTFSKNRCIFRNVLYITCDTFSLITEISTTFGISLPVSELTFQSTQSSIEIGLTILDDSVVQPDLVATLRIFDPSEGVVVDPSTATLTIFEDDTGNYYLKLRWRMHVNKYGHA